jgi:hypothetical protein
MQFIDNHLIFVKAIFCTTWKVGDSGKVVPTLLSIHNLDLHMLF